MKKLTAFQMEYLESLRLEEEEQLNAHKDIIVNFKVHMLTKGLALDDENFKYYTTSGIIATYPGIVSYLHDALQKDKEGLMNFDLLVRHFKISPFSTGYLFADNFMLMAHPFFRRGFHQINNFAPRFVELFWNLNDVKMDKFIAIDNDSVRINVNNSAYMERDTWFGAGFNNEIANIPDGNVKLRPPLDLEDHDIRFFFASAYCLDIKWSTKDGVRTFQAEEFKHDDVTIEKDGNEYFPVRYIHAEFEIDKGYFRHFDGAIHFYTLDEYLDRRDSDFNYNSKSSNHIKTLSEKLFKINGKVSVDQWIELSCHFLTHNPLVFEYFEGRYPQYLEDILLKIRSRSTID